MLRAPAGLGGTAPTRTSTARPPWGLSDERPQGQKKAPCRRDVERAVVRHHGGRDDLGRLLSMDEEVILHIGTTGRRDSQLPWLGWTWDGQRKGTAWWAVGARPGPRKASRGRGTPCQTSLDSVVCRRASKIMTMKVWSTSASVLLDLGHHISLRVERSSNPLRWALAGPSGMRRRT